MGLSLRESSVSRIFRGAKDDNRVAWNSRWESLAYFSRDSGPKLRHYSQSTSFSVFFATIGILAFDGRSMNLL
jgi:hypothetical protein